jgi:hypothetical protein
MKITSFNPMIISKDAGELISLFEELGFEKRHNKVGEDFSGNRMKHSDGFYVDIVEAETPRDIASIRMNVDSFDDAYEMLTSRGFRVVQGGAIENTGSSKSAMMISPSGFAITVAEHLR